MSKIRIISEKILLNKFYSNRFVEYSNRLTETARQHKGFLNSESYFLDNINTDFKDNIKILTISEWENKEYWDIWLKSNERSIISNEFKDVLKEEKFDRLFKRAVNNIFLL